MMTRSGIPALDGRLGGLREGGLYLLAGVPGSGRLVALLQFLQCGLEDGPVGFVTAAPPRRILDESEYWGFALEGAWRDGRLRLLTLGDDFERQLTSAPDPGDVYEEMGELLGPDVGRIAIYPGTPLWDARSGTAFASRFLSWAEESQATILAAIGANLEDGMSPATEWVLESSTGILVLEILSDGLRQISVRRATPAPGDPSPIALDFVPGEGIAAGSDTEQRRGARTDPGSSNLLLLRLAEELPLEVGAWAARNHQVEEVTDVFRSVELVQEAPDRFAIGVIYLDRRNIDAALRACRALRRLAEIPVLLATEDSVRAADRVRGLEAGASDFVSGPLHVRELASRVEHAVITGPRQLENESSPVEEQEDDRTILSAEAFASEVDRRLDEPDGALFTLIEIRAPEATLGARKALRSALMEAVRSKEGDRVGSLPGRLGVILEGTSIKQAPAFIGRVKSRLAEGFRDFEWKATSGSSDAAEIRGLLARPGSPELSRTGT